MKISKQNFMGLFLMYQLTFVYSFSFMPCKMLLNLQDLLVMKPASDSKFEVFDDSSDSDLQDIDSKMNRFSILTIFSGHYNNHTISRKINFVG